MLFEVDARERALAALLPEARTRELGTGDARVGRFVVERKTVADLCASVRDGRWRDQLARLRAFAEAGPGRARGGAGAEASDRHEEAPPDAPPAWRPLVVVEGALSSGALPASSLVSAIAGALVRDGVPTMRTEGVEATAQLLRAIAEREAREEAPSSQSFSTTGRRKSGFLAAPRETALAQLQVVPGVSARTADALLGEHATLGEWAAAWRGRAGELADVRVPGAGGSGGERGRRVGPKLASRLRRTVLGEEEDPSEPIRKGPVGSASAWR